MAVLDLDDGFTRVFGDRRSNYQRKDHLAVELDLAVRMVNQSLFAPAVEAERLHDDGMNTASLVAQLVVRAHPTVELSRLDAFIVDWSPDNVIAIQIHAEADVPDVDTMTAAARELYTKAHGAGWEPESATEAVYEVLVASNSGPDPESMGIEFDCTSSDCRLR